MRYVLPGRLRSRDVSGLELLMREWRAGAGVRDCFRRAIAHRRAVGRLLPALWHGDDSGAMGRPQIGVGLREVLSIHAQMLHERSCSACLCELLRDCISKTDTGRAFALWLDLCRLIRRQNFDLPIARMRGDDVCVIAELPNDFIHCKGAIRRQHGYGGHVSSPLLFQGFGLTEGHSNHQWLPQLQRYDFQEAR